MAAIDFPASPTTGQIFTAAGVTWKWDGAKWGGAPSGGYLPLAGGAMTGPITLAADPAAAMQPTTKRYVDDVRDDDNRIINGDMRINQRGAASGTAGGYTVDRWSFVSSLATKGTWSQSSIGAAVPGFPYCLGFQSNSAYTLAAGDYFAFQHKIEADMVSDFAWGSAAAQPVTLSFWAQSSLTGTFGGCVQNQAVNRTYPFTFSLPTTAWTKIAVTIPGDTGGTWIMSGNASSVLVLFDLGTGTTYRGPANAWAATNYVGATGTVSVLSTANAYLNVTGVKLEIGSTATPYIRQSLAKSLADCQRYYQVNGYLYGFAFNTSIICVLWPFQVPMRAPPTLTLLTTAIYGESPPMGAARQGAGSAINASHANTNTYAVDFSISGFTGMTANTPASISAAQLSVSADL